MSVLQYSLPQGIVELHQVDSVSPRFTVENMFNMAQRQNPKRPFLFVSKVLGRHIPVQPSRVKSAVEALVANVPDDLPGPVLVLGFAETATALGAIVAELLSLKRDDVDFRHSTRHPGDEEVWCEFKELHSHATDHALHWPDQKPSVYRSVILVDDEMTTGSTSMNMLSALRDRGLSNVERCLALTLTDWSLGRVLSQKNVTIERHSLLKGRWGFVPAGEGLAPSYALPQASEPPSPAALYQRYDAGRTAWHGVDLPMWVPPEPLSKPTLVLGVGEHAYLPYKLAERMEYHGGEVYYATMSRSPIIVGGAIDSKVEGVSPYDGSTPFYLYNVADKQWGRILVCLETDITTFDQTFIDTLLRCSEVLEFHINE